LGKIRGVALSVGRYAPLYFAQNKRVSTFTVSFNIEKPQ
jgi:hypothetical protein